MMAFDYGVEASLVFTGDGPSRCQIPFQLASDAIRYAVEELEAGSFDFIYLQVKGKHYDNVEIRNLYDASFYPLNRRLAKSQKRRSPHSHLVH